MGKSTINGDFQYIYVKLPEGTIQFIATQMMFASGHLTSAVAARCSASVAGVSGGCWFHCVYD